MLIKPSLLVIMISLSVLMNGLASEKKDEVKIIPDKKITEKKEVKKSDNLK